MISAEQLELGGAIVIVAVSLVVVAFLAVKLLRPSRVPERVDPWLEGEYEVKVVAGTARPVPPREAFRWPSREPSPDLHGPVRENFRHWLEGGPDYCG